MGYPYIEQQLRFDDLNSDSLSDISYSLRPFCISVKDSLFDDYQSFISSNIKKSRRINFSWLAIQQNLEFNSKYPYDLNNGAMIKSRGLQSYTSTGFYLRLGPLQMQFKPEFIWSENRKYQTFSDTSGPLWNQRIKSWRNIEYPEYFAKGKYSSTTIGNSFVKMTVGTIDMGISNENLWWGPGRWHSLTMTNNASGFKHLFIRSNRFIQSPLGNIQFNILVGKLDSHGQDISYSSGLINNPFRPTYLNDWRYLNAGQLILRPRGLENLEIGFIRTLQQYYQFTKSENQYLPLFYQLKRGDLGNDQIDQQASFFSSLKLPKAKARIYVEAGRGDSPQNMRDVLMNTDHSMGYVIGLQKLQQIFDLPFSVQVEVVKMNRSGSSLFRPEPIWYINNKVKHGYTHKGQIVGGDLPNGTNATHLRLEHIATSYILGIGYDRYNIEKDFYQSLYKTNQNVNPWINNIFGLEYSGTKKKVSFSSAINLVIAKNYQWNSHQLAVNPDFSKETKKSNLFFKCNLAYAF